MDEGTYTTAMLARTCDELQHGIAVMCESEARWRVLRAQTAVFQGERWHLAVSFCATVAFGSTALLWLAQHHAPTDPLVAATLGVIVIAVVVAFANAFALWRLPRLIGPLARITIRDPLTFHLGILSGSRRCDYCTHVVRGPAVQADRDFLRDIALGVSGRMARERQDGRLTIGLHYHPGCLCDYMARMFSARARAGNVQLTLTCEQLERHQALDAELSTADAFSEDDPLTPSLEAANAADGLPQAAH